MRPPPDPGEAAPACRLVPHTTPMQNQPGRSGIPMTGRASPRIRAASFKGWAPPRSRRTRSTPSRRRNGPNSPIVMKADRDPST